MQNSINLQVGKHYKLCNGNVITIIYYKPDTNEVYNYIGSNIVTYKSTGACTMSPHPLDIVEEVILVEDPTHNTQTINEAQKQLYMKQTQNFCQPEITQVSDPNLPIWNTAQTKFTTGAVRSTDANSTHYHSISPIGIRRLAETHKAGNDKYGFYNWEKGMPISDILNHGLRHIFKYLEGDRSEDHLAHAAWNLFAAMHMEEAHPNIEHGLRPTKDAT